MTTNMSYKNNKVKPPSGDMSIFNIKCIGGMQFVGLNELFAIDGKCRAHCIYYTLRKVKTCVNVI